MCNNVWCRAQEQKRLKTRLIPEQWHRDRYTHWSRCTVILAATKSYNISTYLLNIPLHPGTYVLLICKVYTNFVVYRVHYMFKSILDTFINNSILSWKFFLSQDEFTYLLTFHLVWLLASLTLDCLLLFL